MRHGTSAAPPKSAGKELEKEGAAWIAGKDTLPQLADSVKPKHDATAFHVNDFSSLQMFGYIVPTYCEREKEGKEREQAHARSSSSRSEQFVHQRIESRVRSPRCVVL